MSLLPQWSSVRVPVIGMLHLPPLPGSSRWSGDLNAVRDFVLRDVEALCAGGVDGLMIENFGDTPFYPGRVPAITVAAMTALACEVRRATDVPLGINMLRNDGLSALAVAVASGASFIRVNVLCGARVTDQGLLQGIAHDLLRERANLKAESIRPRRCGREALRPAGRTPAGGRDFRRDSTRSRRRDHRLGSRHRQRDRHTDFGRRRARFRSNSRLRR